MFSHFQKGAETPRLKAQALPGHSEAKAGLVEGLESWGCRVQMEVRRL